MEGDLIKVKCRLYYMLNWLWNIFEEAEPPECIFHTKTKHSITQTVSRVADYIAL